jgi:2-hydroxychromene-2-carboxylate isomerase
MSDARTVEFFFDVGSPATYLAWTQLPGLCAAAGATLVHRPMLVGAVFKATGNASPITIPAKGRWVIEDLARYARRYGVPLALNPHFPVNTLLPMRIATGVQRERSAEFESLQSALFRAMWVDQQNVGDPAVLGTVLGAAGLDAAALLALAERQDVKDALKATTEEAIRRGAFGAPTMFVGDSMFFGQDRLDFVREALVRR